VRYDIDLHTSNILLQIPGLKSWNNQQILSHFGKPRRYKSPRLDGLPVEPCPGIPRYMVAVSHVKKPFNFNGSIMIADFGSAFRSSRGAKCLPTSVEIGSCAPERILGYPFDLPSDIWSLGCTIFATISGLEPFGNNTAGEDATFFRGEDVTLLDILRTLGKPSESWWTQWPEEVKEYVLADQDVMNDAIISCSLAERIREISSGNDDGDEVEPMPVRKGEFSDGDIEVVDLLSRPMPVRKGEFSDGDIEGMVDLLSRMLVHEPERRLTASEVLAHPWMKSLQAEVELSLSASA